ncbi:hypothetical protein AAG570_009996 [Ranatra chinensis]|uniref:Uncharacterized protein n=1 Tax=Ranatra chinensis TaxID=642074 RepID=A0ABD0ZBX9_9HEMI
MASKRRNMFHKNKTQETTEEEGDQPGEASLVDLFAGGGMSCARTSVHLSMSLVSILYQQSSLRADAVGLGPVLFANWYSADNCRLTNSPSFMSDETESHRASKVNKQCSYCLLKTN